MVLELSAETEARLPCNPVFFECVASAFKSAVAGTGRSGARPKRAVLRGGAWCPLALRW